MLPSSAEFEIEVFYDGGCPLCMREIRMLQGRDRRQRIRFVDIATDGFDAASVGLTWDALMERIHGRLPDGTLVEGVEVFRRLYAAIGFGPLVSLTRLPGIRQLLDVAYDVFARNRLRLTGRCVDGACEVVDERRQEIDGPLLEARVRFGSLSCVADEPRSGTRSSDEGGHDER